MTEPGQTLERLRDGFNYCNYDDRRDVFVRTVIDAVRQRGPSCVVLDVGCGRGIRRDKAPQRKISELAATMWGIEPDQGIEPDSEIFDRVWRCTFEQAPLPPAAVDVVYAHMVVEHVAEPEAFTRRLYEVLRPGGCALFLTINATSYLGRAARAARALGVQEHVLRISRGCQEVSDYHYPALYRFNSPREIREAALAAGFARIDTVYLEGGEARVYFPKPLRWIPRLIELKQRLLRQDRNFTNLLVRLGKKP